MTRPKLALTVGLALMGATVGAALLRSPLTVAGTNSVPAPNLVKALPGNGKLCVQGGTIPRNTVAVRIPFTANVGPRVSVQVTSGSRALTAGAQAAGWGLDESVTVALKRVTHQVRDTHVCVTIGPISPYLAVGATIVTVTSPTGRVRTTEELHLEYLRRASTSWSSLVPSIARHLGLGHAVGGLWNAGLAIALMIGVVCLSSRLALAGRPTRTLGVRRGLRRIPTAAWTCALIACMNAACWSIITPPFQVPDEPSHFAYTQQLAENHRLPPSSEFNVSPEEEVALRDLHQREVQLHPEIHTLFTVAQQQQLQHDLAQRRGRHGGGGVGGAKADPPLYYALEIIPYELGSPGTLLDQLQLMRLMGALMAGITTLFTFLFIREALPRFPWTWTTGALAVGLVPLLGFMSGAVSPDSMLFAVAAALIYCFAHGFRHGLTRRPAIVISVLTVTGMLTKLSFLGLVPGIALGLGVLALRSQASRRAGVRRLGLALAIAAGSACALVLVDRPALKVVSGVVKQRAGQTSASGMITYIWQFYLPPLPGMSSLFPGFSMPQIWFDRSVGLYGWLDTSFPLWVDRLALAPVGLVALLCLRTLVANRSALRRRLVEIVVYAAIGLGLMMLVAASNYFDTQEGLAYVEPRYLLPMLPFLGAVLALAARAGGRRWGPSVGVLIVTLVLTHDLISQLLVVSRYYA